MSSHRLEEQPYEMQRTQFYQMPLNPQMSGVTSRPPVRPPHRMHPPNGSADQGKLRTSWGLI